MTTADRRPSFNPVANAPGSVFFDHRVNAFREAMQQTQKKAARRPPASLRRCSLPLHQSSVFPG